MALTLSMAKASKNMIKKMAAAKKLATKKSAGAKKTPPDLFSDMKKKGATTKKRSAKK